MFRIPRTIVKVPDCRFFPFSRLIWLGPSAYTRKAINQTFI